MVIYESITTGNLKAELHGGGEGRNGMMDNGVDHFTNLMVYETLTYMKMNTFELRLKF